MTSKTNLGLVAWALEWLGRPYWYGTCCYKCTDSLHKRKKAQYPSHYGSSRTNRYKADIKAGKSCCDCIGLIKGYYWTRDDGVQVYRLDGRPDQSANGAYSASKVKGAIKTLPEILGLILHSPGHVGVYIGGGYAIEARGFNYGVVKTKVSSRSWTHWFKSPYIDYIEDGATPPVDAASPGTSYKRLLRYKRGSTMIRGNDVVFVQETLLALGYKPGIPDGIYGPQTAAAVTAFQKTNNLEVDGIVGRETWAALEAKNKIPALDNGESSTTPDETLGQDPSESDETTDGDTDPDDSTDDGSEPIEPDDTPLDFGTRILKYVKGRTMQTGVDVIAVQTRLVQLGFDPCKIDGIYGSKTAAAVKSFQKSVKILADGEVGPDTRGKLLE